LLEQKKKIDAEVDAKRKEAKEFEVLMRAKASTVGNIVGKNVPVSQTEVCYFFPCSGIKSDLLLLYVG
jgi:seryl-tRNA synthetase